MEVKYLGLIDYEEALKIQEQAVASVRQNRKESEVILVCEHPLVITIGRGVDSKKEVFATQVPVHEVSRGGRATLHLPGQLVVYPIVDLSGRGRDLHAYMRVLEIAIIETLADFRIEAESIPGKTGVWVLKSLKTGGPRKIASLGIAVKDWVTYHGLALNVSCELGAFSQISPCGFPADVMTSMTDEMSSLYKQEWVQTMGRLDKDVRNRLVENLKPRLEMANFKLTEDEILLMGKSGE